MGKKLFDPRFNNDTRCLTDVQTARVSRLRPLLPGQWVLVAADLEGHNNYDIYLAQGTPFFHYVLGLI
jgi:hypothetical protein